MFFFDFNTGYFEITLSGAESNVVALLGWEGKGKRLMLNTEKRAPKQP